LQFLSGRQMDEYDIGHWDCKQSRDSLLLLHNRNSVVLDSISHSRLSAISLTIGGTCRAQFEEMSICNTSLPKSALLMRWGICVDGRPTISSHVGKLDLRVVIEEYKGGGSWLAVLSSLLRCCQSIPATSYLFCSSELNNEVSSVRKISDNEAPSVSRYARSKNCTH
jgi:hypothetical protein